MSHIGYNYRDKYHRNNVYEIMTININDVGLVWFGFSFSLNGEMVVGFGAAAANIPLSFLIPLNHFNNAKYLAIIFKW